VQQVAEGSPAQIAGLQVGDMIISLNGEPIKTGPQLSQILAGLPAGARANLLIARNGKRQNVTVILGLRPDNSPAPRR
jgi:serine protease Do